MAHIEVDSPLILCESEMESIREVQFLDRKVAFFSTRSPTKSTVNEDALAMIPFDAHSGALVVADGMGGHASGEIASRLAIECMAQAILGAAKTEALLRTGIINGIEDANQAVIELANGAGTTLSVTEISGEGVRPYHVGDSSILVVGNRGKLKLETTAHSPVGFGLAAGLLDDNEAVNHDEAHVVLNAIGNQKMRIEIGPRKRLARRDTLLIASDGLSDNLSVDETVEIIRKGSLGTSLTRLVQTCRERMQHSNNSKPDDLTIIALRPQ